MPRLGLPVRTLLLPLTLALALLGGCAGGPFDAPAVGQSGDSVIARFGRPTRVVALPSGQRLQYSRQPFGQQAWMVDLDAAGRVTRAEQVLTEDGFRRIAVDRWTREDVEREFGPPAQVDAVASWSGPILNYRWRDAGGADMLYWVYLDAAGVVRRTQAGMEFRGSRSERD
ncbi:MULTISPECIES: hypothetical protein [Ramlibacter]|uniref:Lipoprotein transmembrane n=1 Tax=Ramlibacter aquaticus TaxID=2780094 RepID=A0ABR9SAM3_9BURK|nr:MULTISPECIES: hypothetical protein [Ramlibacter]MBE7939396.1 hypothetical protein [Ramlibacter aquaticus]